jgi:hypothetical protein
VELQAASGSLARKEAAVDAREKDLLDRLRRLSSEADRLKAELAALPVGSPGPDGAKRVWIEGRLREIDDGSRHLAERLETLRRDWPA